MNPRHSVVILVLLVAALALASGCIPPPPASVGVVPAKGTAGSEAQGPVALTFTGLVETDLTLSMADLEAMGTAELTIEHPKEGSQTYAGVCLSTLLDRAEPAADAVLTFTAVDAYAVDVPVADARAC